MSLSKQKFRGILLDGSFWEGSGDQITDNLPIILLATMVEALGTVSGIKASAHQIHHVYLPGNKAVVMVGRDDFYFFAAGDHQSRSTKQGSVAKYFGGWQYPAKKSVFFCNT
ncbi:MAG: hypothetical protein V1838_05905 [Patescibacteria group bacterium]